MGQLKRVPYTCVLMTVLLGGFYSGGCARLTEARPDPNLLNKPVYEPLAAGPEIVVEWVSVNGARPPGDELDRAVAHYRGAVAGEVQLLEGESIELDLGEDGAVSIEQFDAIIDRSERTGPFDILVVFASDFDFDEVQAIYTYTHVEDEGKPLPPHRIRVNVKEMGDVGAARLFVTESEIWEFGLTHELFHSLGVPSDRTHAWDGWHCTRVGCLLYPGVVDLRSRTRLVFQRNVPLTLCDDCASELAAARASAAGRRWDPDLDYGWLWLDRYVALNPKEPRAYGRRYSAAMAREDYAQAMADANKFIELYPDSPWHYVLRGRVYTAVHDRQGAVSDYEAALAIEPEHSVALGELAWLLATSPEDRLRDGPRAIELATRACTLSDWENAALIDTLACALAETNDFESAIRHQTKAMALAEEEDADAYARRLALFRAGKPYRDSEVPPAAPEG